MTEYHLNWKRLLEIPFGNYFQIHKEYITRNSTKPRTMGDISMGNSGNNQGGFKFITLESMKKVTRRIWDEIPLSDTIIAQVNTLDQGQSNSV